MTRLFLIFALLFSINAAAQEGPAHDIAQAAINEMNAAQPEAGIESSPAPVDAAPCVDSGEASASVKELIVGSLEAIVMIVFLIELFRYAVAPFRRKKGVVLTEGKRSLIVLIGLVLGQVMAFAGVVPPVRPGELAKVLSGAVATSGAILFNETIWKWIRSYFSKKFGSEKHEHKHPAGDAK